jgi:hypothetical protein
MLSFYISTFLHPYTMLSENMILEMLDVHNNNAALLAPGMRTCESDIDTKAVNVVPYMSP